MSDIVLLANSEDMRMVAAAAIQYTGADIPIVVTHTYEESQRLAVEFKEKGCRMLIARGGHARAIRAANIGIPVMPIPFTGNNIAALLTQASADWGEFAVVGNPTMIQMTKELERSIGAKVHYYDVHRWEDINDIMIQVRNAGLKAVVGGYDACARARALGLHDYCIKTSEYEIVTAIMDAGNLVASIERDRYWDTIFRATLDTISDGLIVADADGNVTHANRRAMKLVGKDGALNDLLNEEMRAHLTQAIQTKLPVYDELMDFDERKLSVSFMPMRHIDGKAVIVIQEPEYVHKVERKIRQKLSSKGLVAKNSFDSITAVSPALREAVRIAKTYASADSTVLISGETGTGKEMFAQSIHNFSRRADEAFVAVNCATIPANLLESELFGYVEGAFTGAKKGGKVGLFELAHKGTIFLDEIGETSLDMQARLLRVLEEHEIMRVGDDKVIPVDIRIIAASNRDLHKLVEEGKFRPDFYYRLDILALHLPPLRESRENILPLLEHYTERYARQNNRLLPVFDEESRSVLVNYPWPGNVRELKNVAERLVVTNTDPVIHAREVRSALHLSAQEDLKVAPETRAHRSSAGILGAAEQELLERVLQECGGNKTAAAKKLGISRPTLHKKLKQIEERKHHA